MPSLPPLTRAPPAHSPNPTCEVGTVVLDPVSGAGGAGRSRLDCNRCNFLMYLPANMHSVKVTRDTCEVRGTHTHACTVFALCVACAL